MSKKRRDDDDEQQKRNLDSTCTFQTEVRAKHAKLASSTSTTLLDLPLEIHEHILSEVILSEIRHRRLVRCGWKDSADRVAERLRHVCPQWDSLLTTNSFRKRLHGIIDTFPSMHIRLEPLDTLWFSTWCIAVGVLDDEYFLLCQPRYKHAVIRVCKGDDLEKAKRLIQLPAVTFPWNLVACPVSSCLYVMHKAPENVEILRIFSREGQHFQVVPFITCSVKLVSRMCVSGDGSLIVYQGPAPSTITTYNADGLVQRQIELTKPLSSVREIISKSNGNVIIVSRSITEINSDGDVLYDYHTQDDGGFRGQICCAVDMNDYIIAADVGHSVKLFDSDFNQAKVTVNKWESVRCWKNLYRLHFNRQRNEFLLLDCCDADAAVTRRHNQALKIFRVTERISSDDDAKWEEELHVHFDLLDEGEAQNAEEEDSASEEDSESEEDSSNEEN